MISPLVFEPKLPFSVALAEGERLQRLQMDHFALLVQRDRDGAEAAEHARARKFLVEHIEMLHAVEQWQDRGVRPHRRRKGFYRIVEVEGLAAEQHDVELFG